MPSMLEHALAYAERGWPVFPCQPDKSPHTKHGVMDSTTTIPRIEEYWTRWPDANIGLDCGAAGLIVLDGDPGFDEAELIKNIGEIPVTHLISKTPRGGNHRFFELGREEIAAPSQSKLAKHLDIRSHNSYVLLPPSRTKDGTYEWVEEGKPAYRSDAMLEAANTGRSKHEDRDTWLIEPDLEENINKATTWLQTDAQIAIEGQGGDGMAYATAAHMKSFGISPDLALELMWDHWNPRCDPPWSGDEYEHFTSKVENGYSYNTSPPGNITSAYRKAAKADLFTAVVSTKDEEWNAGRFRFVNKKGMGNIKPPNWLIKNFLPENSYSIIFGAYSSFKTFIALDIALSISCGQLGTEGKEPWHDDVATMGPILFAAGEGRADIAKRVRAWDAHHRFGIESNPNFFLADPVPLVSEELKPFINGARMASPDGYKLVIIDTVGRSMAGLNENSQEHASAFTNMVENIQYELKCAVLCLHHIGHAETARARGSSVFGADADMMLRLDRVPNSMTIKLTMTKQKDAQEWDKPKFIKMHEHAFDVEKEITSLVAMSGQEMEDKEEARQEKKATVNAVTYEKVEAGILRFLKKYPDRKLSLGALAVILGNDKKVPLKTSQAKKYLIAILENPESSAYSCFHVEEISPDKWWFKPGD
jgi:hypothetical protein